MRGEAEAIEEAGGQLVFIGSGTPLMAAEFEREHALGAIVLTDPSLRSFKRMHLKRGVGATLGPSSAVQAVRAVLGGHRQSRSAGDAWQQGGVFVADGDGSVRYSQVNEDAGARPDIEAILDAVESVARRPQTV